MFSCPVSKPLSRSVEEQQSRWVQGRGMNVAQTFLASQRWTQIGSQIQECNTTAQERNQDLPQGRALSQSEKHVHK